MNQHWPTGLMNINKKPSKSLKEVWTACLPAEATKKQNQTWCSGKRYTNYKEHITTVWSSNTSDIVIANEGKGDNFTAALHISDIFSQNSSTSLEMSFILTVKTALTPGPFVENQTLCQNNTCEMLRSCDMATMINDKNMAIVMTVHVLLPHCEFKRVQPSRSAILWGCPGLAREAYARTTRLITNI